MNKTAVQIFGKFNDAPQTWCSQDMVRRRAGDCQATLKRLLNGLDLQKELCLEYTRRKEGYPLSTCYPSWAYKLADILYDPGQKRSDNVKNLLAYQCNLLLADFDSEHQYHIHFMMHQDDVALLAKVAQDLYTGSTAH